MRFVYFDKTKREIIVSLKVYDGRIKNYTTIQTPIKVEDFVKTLQEFMFFEGFGENKLCDRLSNLNLIAEFNEMNERVTNKLKTRRVK